MFRQATLQAIFEDRQSSSGLADRNSVAWAWPEQLVKAYANRNGF
jgi:hypothetical protein